MKNELDYILHTYFSVPNIRIKYCGETSHLDGFKGIISNLVSFDHPDAYAIIENEVFIFEHFEFDGSDNQSRKGSQQHRLVESENRVFSDWTPSPELPIYRGTINANYTLENYRNNLIKSFNKHYNEIDAYIETLRTKRIIKGNERITTIFFIEDISLFGSYIISNNNDGSIKPLELPLCDFFLDLFEHSEKLDIVVSAIKETEYFPLWYIDKRMIQEYKHYQIDTSDAVLINYTPHRIGFKIPINMNLEKDNEE